MSTILIAEDEERIAAFVEKGLRSAGYTTTRESQVDPNTGSRIDRTDVDPR